MKFLKPFIFVIGTAFIHCAAAQTDQGNIDPNVQNVINGYNARYGTSFQTPPEIMKDINDKARVFYASIRECADSYYEYPYIFPDGIGSIIGTVAPEQNYCSVKMQYKYVNGQLSGRTFTCQYAKQDLPLFTDAVADRAETEEQKEAIAKLQRTHCRWQ